MGTCVSMWSNKVGKHMLKVGESFEDITSHTATEPYRVRNNEPSPINVEALSSISPIVDMCFHVHLVYEMCWSKLQTQRKLL